MEGKIEKIENGKVVESLTFNSKDDAIMHIIGLMETFNISTEELEY